MTFVVLITVVLSTACNDRRVGMDAYKRVPIERINISAPRLIKNWMLITAGDTASFNTMTASWGTLGHMWEKNVAIVTIRPQRYTKEFVDANDVFTVSFYNETHRDALTICGTKSGRDTDKVREAGLRPFATPAGSVAFAEANMILECRKLYAAPFDSAAFIDKTIVGEIYRDGDFHTLYVGEIINAYRRK